MKNFEDVMNHFKVTFPVIDAALLKGYVSSLAAQGVLPPSKRKIIGTASSYAVYIYINQEMNSHSCDDHTFQPFINLQFNI